MTRPLTNQNATVPGELFKNDYRATSYVALLKD